MTFIDFEPIEKAVGDYFIGSTKDGRTVFWYIYRESFPRTGKIITFPVNDHHRDKSRHPSWVHYELKKAKLLPETFEHRLCFFGEHLLDKNKTAPVAVVEAEKTAVVGSIFLPRFIWLAVGAKSWLKAEKLRRLKGRKIYLYPDSDTFELWSLEAEDARRSGLNVSVSRIIEDAATEEERKNGFDLADYLIQREIEAQKWNEHVDAYNSKVDLILADKELLERFDELYEERLAFTQGEGLEPEEIRTILEYTI